MIAVSSEMKKDEKEEFFSVVFVPLLYQNPNPNPQSLCVNEIRALNGMRCWVNEEKVTFKLISVKKR